MTRRAVDRVIGLFVRLLAQLFHRRLEFDGVDALRRSGPRLVVVNHFNGFMDVVLVTAALGRLPRFVGKATLANVVVARPFLRLAGVVLVQRRIDGADTDQNARAFEQCDRRLAAGDCVVIFPEGTTHDREALAEIRTGAARIALSARQQGVDDLRVVPVGLTYGDKTRLRNRALVVVGDPISVPSTPAGEDDHDAVRSLTSAVTAAIDALVPGVDDPLRAWAHERAAAVHAGVRGTPDDLRSVLATARRTLDADQATASRVEHAIADYALALDLAGVADVSVGAADPGFVRRVVAFSLLTWIAMPMIAAAVVANAPAVGLIALVDLFVGVPVTKGTARALVAVVAFPTTWIVVGAIAVDGVAWVAFAAIGNALALLLTLWIIERDIDLIRRLVARHRAIQAAGRIPELQRRRDAVADAVDAAMT
jgi:glycerol-3-phosphate O-acyltransferase / dihydroxyacetone phosphate acyltransferase